MQYCLTHLSLQWHFPPERNFGNADNQKVIIYSRQNNYRQLLTQNSTKIWQKKKNNMNDSVKFTVRKATREVFMWLYLQIHCVWRCALWERKSRITARRHDSFFFSFFFYKTWRNHPHSCLHSGAVMNEKSGATGRSVNHSSIHSSTHGWLILHFPWSVLNYDYVLAIIST